MPITFGNIDEILQRKLLLFLRPTELLNLVALSTCWSLIVGSCVQKLVIRDVSAVPPLAAIAASCGFATLRSLILDGSRGGTYWLRVATLLRTLSATRLEKLERISLHGLGLNEPGTKAAEPTTHIDAAQLAVQIARTVPTLTRLDLVRIDLSSPAGQILCDFINGPIPPPITELSLAGCMDPFRHVGGALRGLIGSQLQCLDLSSGNLLVYGAAELAGAMQGMHCLKKLFLSDNGLGPQGALYMQGLTGVAATLEELDLSANGLGPQALRLLSPTLAQCKKLRVLNLRGSWASSDATSLLDVLRASSATLERLDISQNRIGPHGMADLLGDWPDMPHLRSLRLSENPFATDLDAVGTESRSLGLGRLAQNSPHIEELRLGGIGLGWCRGALNSIASSLPHGLRVLDLSASKLGPEELERLHRESSTLSELRILSLVQARLSASAVKTLAIFVGSLPNLRELDIRGNDISPPCALALEKELRHCNPALRLTCPRSCCTRELRGAVGRLV